MAMSRKSKRVIAEVLITGLTKNHEIKTISYLLRENVLLRVYRVFLEIWKESWIWYF